MPITVCVLLNPAAGRGSARKKMEALKPSLIDFGVERFFETRSPGDEGHQAQAAIEQGFETIIVIGGDGTCSGVANVILERSPKCRLCVIPVGTGNDFAKTLGVINLSPIQVCELAINGVASRIDVGVTAGRFFLNSCGFGFDASVLEASYDVRLLKGDAVYIYAALRQLFSYRGIDVSASGAPGVERSRMLMVTVSNGRFLGGAFKVAPHASVLDGKLDACFFGDSNVIERVKLFVGAMRGTHVGMRSVSTASVQGLSLTFANSPLMEIDGELRRATSSTVELKCVPRALSVIAAPGALA